MRNHKRFLLAALGGLMLLNTPAEVQAAPKKILVITQSAGFRHQPVNRAGKETCQVEHVLAEIGKKSGVFTTVNSQNAIDSITRENLKQFDGMFFIRQACYYQQVIRAMR